jgi:uncharacterized RDD family membrane protein YckC
MHKMQYSILVSLLTVLVRFGFPLIIFFGLALGYLRAPEFFKKCLVDKRVISILILGAFPASIINVPFYFDENIMFALNLGGVIIPVIISIIFILRMRLNYWSIILSIIAVSLIAYLITYVNPDIGVVSDFPWYLIPVLVTLLLALFRFRSRLWQAVPFAYSVSTLGILIGSDIARLPVIIQEDIGVGYIGGFGIFDLIFLSGLYSLALTLFLAYPTSKYPPSRKTVDNKFVSKLIEQTRFSSFTSRAKAYGIDCLLQGMILGIIFVLILTSYNFNITEFLLSFWSFSLFWWAVVFHIAYFTFFEWYSGQTPGKKFTKIQVVNLEPIEKSRHMKHHINRLEFLSVFTRNILRLVDLILFIFVIYRLIVSPKHQRYGDLFAGTSVINK